MSDLSDESRHPLGWVALAGFVGCVWLANYFITHVGDVPFPGGPHTIPVGFGYDAPSGVLWIGVALVLRDVVQRHLGKRAAVAGVLVGAALSYFIAPSFAFASGAAFLVSELLDFAIWTPLAQRGRIVAGAVASNTVGLLVDTFLFLQIAFGSTMFWQGQVIGKSYATLAALPVLLWMRRPHATDGDLLDAIAARRGDAAFMERLRQRVEEDGSTLDRLGHQHRYPGPNATGFPVNQCLDCGGWIIAAPDLTPPPGGHS